MKDTPTISSLAKMAGVSNATVSLALRNHPRIRPEVRKHIQSIAAKVGYIVDPIVANLLTQLRSKKKHAYQSTLGVLSLWETADRIKSIHTFNEWIGGCHERAASLGYSLDHFSLVEPATTPERLVKVLRARNIRGLLVLGAELSSIVRVDLDPIWDYSTAVVLGVVPRHPRLSFISNDQFFTIVQAFHEVLKLGYKRPGLCIHPDIDHWVENRFSGGFYVGQQSLPKKHRIPLFPFTQNAGPGFAAWIKKYRPDVVLTLHLETLNWIKDLGLKVPEDMGMVHLDRTPAMPCAGMHQNNEDIGRGAVDMVVGQLYRNEFGIPAFQKGMSVESLWTPGPTLRPQEALSVKVMPVRV